MRVTTKGQVTIPKDVRDKLGIEPGDEVGFREEGEAFIIEKVEAPAGESDGERLVRQLAELGRKARAEGWASGLSADDIMDATRGPKRHGDPR